MPSVDLAAGDLLATFEPDLGMLGTALSWLGLPLLELWGGLDAWREQRTTGMPLLHPWANRLRGWSYAAAGVEVDLSGLPLHDDGAGHPMHGTNLGAAPWHLDGSSWTSLSASRHVDEPAFPFPHRLEVDVSTSTSALAVTTRITPTADRAVPVCFGWHPYFILPGVPRPDWVLRLPERTHVVTGADGLPTGEEVARPEEADRLGDALPDDHFRLASDRRVWVQGGGTRLTLDLARGYDHLQVFAHPEKGSLALEPMTARVAGLSDGRCPLAAPGERYTATFVLTPGPAGVDAPEEHRVRDQQHP